MRTWSLGSLILVGWLAVGCAYTEVRPRAAGAVAALSSDSTAWVLVPEDGQYGPQVYAGSGQAVANATIEAMSPAPPLMLLMPGIDLHRARIRAATEDVDWVVVPSLIHWEDRATNWSGRRDLIRVDLSVYRTNPWELAAQVMFEARNSWFTLFNNPPRDLLDEEYTRAVRTLLGAADKD